MVAFLILVFYGSQVCPFIESLSAIEQIIPLLIIFWLQWAARERLHQKISGNNINSSASLLVFIIEWVIFALGGVVLLLYNSIFYKFPIESGVKMIVGFSAVGFFTALIVVLKYEYKMACDAINDKDMIGDINKYFPLVLKFRIFASITLLLALVTLGLIVLKDINLILETEGQIAIGEQRRAVVFDFVYVGLVLLGYVFYIIVAYTKNLTLFFSQENETLTEVSLGNLSVRVPILSRDEFGVIALKTNKMIDALQQKTKALEDTQDITILALASLAETRDNETGMHIRRTQYYVRALASQLQGHPDFSDFLTDDAIELMFKSAPLHDIGKVGIPDAILLKPGKLTDDEFEVMKTHAELGEQALLEAMGDTPETSFLRYARDIAGSHHEKWDGTGYPKGLKGDDIPFSARLMAVADVYDALISRRVYKPPFSHDKAMSIIKQGRGSHFDPRIVDATFAIEEQIIEIARVYKDENLD
jgi:HD-GYP domain-containing protein (c-di-GMP phosphodiesterase class II)